MGLRFTPLLAINGPEVDYIEGNTVHFKPHNEQIEVFKYTAVDAGEHINWKKNHVYPDSKGRRFKPLMFLKKAQNSWTVDLSMFRSKKRNYFKFCFRDKDNGRTALTNATIATCTIIEGNGSKCIRMFN